ncbi:MAG: aspartate kinase, partial [Nitrososphaerales archaeon]
ALTGVRSLKELTPRSLDYITSFGERLMVPILAGSLESVGLRVKHFTGGEAGILTDEAFGEATPLMNITKHRVKKTLSPLLEENIIPVVTGFNGVTQHGEISTIGRGGSDYTAMIIGSSLDVDEVLIWSDVDGIMTADPRIIAGAKVIKQLSYDEAAEMAIMGARGMHPRALEPAKDGSIPVRIKNSFNSEAEGTLISKELHIHTGEVAKAIASINDLAMISLSGMSMVGKPGMAGEIFGVLARAKVNIIMISQSISESNITLMVRKSQLPKALSSLELALLGKGTVREITFEDDVSVISIVGAGMKGAPGVAAKLFGAVAEHDINVRMIAQGSSELNISFVVKEKDSAEATRIIHERFNMVN